MQDLSTRQVQDLLRQHDKVVFISVVGPDEFAEDLLFGTANIPYDERFSERLTSAVSADAHLVFTGRGRFDLTVSLAADEAVELGYQNVSTYSAAANTPDNPTTSGRQSESPQTTRYGSPPPRH